MAVSSDNTHANGSNDLFNSSSAFLFPGQGSQEVGMGQDLYEQSKAARRIFDEADSALDAPLTEIMFQGPADELERTINSQPAILTVSLACLAATAERAGRPLEGAASFMAGHSLGEYTALTAAGALDMADAVRLVRERGRLMQDACDQRSGSMAAVIGMEEQALEEICRETGIQIANINSPGQIVISGATEGVAKATELASERGAKRVIPLRVSGAFHSYLMGSAMDGMTKALETVKFRNPTRPVIANCTGKPLTASWELKEELIQQLCGCVRWQNSVDYMVNAGVTNFIEFGPGRALSGMVKRISDCVEVTSVNNVESTESLVNGHSSPA